MAVAAPSESNDNKRRFSYYLNRLFHYSMVETVAVGRGSYFGLSMFALFFGSFFAKFDSPIGFFIRSALGISSTSIFIGLFTRKEYQAQSKFEKIESDIEQLKNHFKQLTQNNKKYQNDALEYCNNLHKIAVKKDEDNTWTHLIKYWYFKFYHRLFESLNSGKDFVKGLIIIGSMYGLTIPVVMSMASPAVFIAFCVVSAVFTVCSGLEYELNQRRKRQQKQLTEQKFFLERLIRIEKYYSNDVKNRKKYKKALEKSKEAYISSSPEINTDRFRLAIATAFGLLNGLYFGFIMDEVFTKILTFYPTPVYLSITLGVLWSAAWMIDNFSKEYCAQQDLIKTKAKHYRNKLKWSKKTQGVNPESLPSYKNKILNKDNEEKKSSSLAQYFFDIIEGGRAATNVTKLVNFSLQILGVAVASQLGFMGTFGIVPTITLIIFVSTSAGSGIALNNWNNRRASEKATLENEIAAMKEDCAKIDTPSPPKKPNMKANSQPAKVPENKSRPARGSAQKPRFNNPKLLEITNFAPPKSPTFESNSPPIISVGNGL